MIERHRIALEKLHQQRRQIAEVTPLSPPTVMARFSGVKRCVPADSAFPALMIAVWSFPTACYWVFGVLKPLFQRDAQCKIAARYVPLVLSPGLPVDIDVYGFKPACLREHLLDKRTFIRCHFIN